MVSTYVSELSWEMLSKIFSSNSLLIISGVVSLLSFSRRYPTMPSPVGSINTKAAAPPNFRSTSSRICDLPVTNIRVSSDSRAICPNDSRITIRCSGTHSSRASTHINVRFVVVIVWNIFKIPDTCSPLPPITFLWFRKDRTTVSGIPSNPPTSCRNREPSMFTGDCSLREAKSK